MERVLPMVGHAKAYMHTSLQYPQAPIAAGSATAMAGRPSWREACSQPLRDMLRTCAKQQLRSLRLRKGMRRPT